MGSSLKRFWALRSSTICFSQARRLDFIGIPFPPGLKRARARLRRLRLRVAGVRALLEEAEDSLLLLLARDNARGVPGSPDDVRPGLVLRVPALEPRDRDLVARVAWPHVAVLLLDLLDGLVARELGEDARGAHDDVVGICLVLG